MKAWVATRLGTPRQALQLRTNLPTPPPPSGSDILIRVHYAALNPADVGFMAFLSPLIPFRRAPVPGLDFAGVVVRAGPGAGAAVQVGARVCGAVSVGLHATNTGSLAEYVVVPEGLVAVVPEGLGLREACGLGIVGQTAVIAHREASGLGKGGRVLVNGASGGLGAMVVQIAKGRGAWVVGVCSGPNEEFVRGLGADEVCLVFS